MEIKGYLNTFLLVIFLTVALNSFSTTSVFAQNDNPQECDEQTEEDCPDDPPVFPPLPDNDDRIAGSSDAFGTPFGREEVTSIEETFDIQSESLTPANHLGITVARDLKVTFKVSHGEEASNSNRTIVSLNGSEMFRTPFFTRGPERSFEFLINRNDLSLGNNQLEFAPQRTGESTPWGIRAISIEYLPVFEFQFGLTNSQSIGLNPGSTPRDTGARINVMLPEANTSLLLSVDGFDIDVADEMEVFANGSSIGFLSTAPQNQFRPNEFSIPAELVSSGLNQFEFRQRYPSSGFSTVSDLIWGTRNFRLTLLLPDLAISELATEQAFFKENQPFSTTITVSNLNESFASDVAVTFFFSDDDLISESDQLLSRFEIDDINGEFSEEFSFELSASEIGSEVFLGACITSSQLDFDDNNNCSEAISISNQAVISPIYLLLDD